MFINTRGGCGIGADLSQMGNVEREDYCDAAMKLIMKDSGCVGMYDYVRKHKDWGERFMDFLKGKRSLPLLYDPFFKKIFSAAEHKERLSELVSCLLGQNVTVLEVLPNEDSQFLGVLVIMDMVVRMSDGSIANIEIQKISYDFPAERISCYSADLVMRQYKMITGNEETFGEMGKVSYKNMRKVHTIILFEKSSASLISELDEKLYYHVGKTKFNTGIKIELLQDFLLISLDTFRKYRYSDIREGRIEVNDYDYDSTQYSGCEVTEEMKHNRLKYLSLFVAETPQEIDRLVDVFPELDEVRRDINEYLVRPKEVLNMFSEALRILDRNTAELMVDRMNDEIEKLKGVRSQLESENSELEGKNSELEGKNSELENRNSELEAEVARLKKQLEQKNEN